MSMSYAIVYAMCTSRGTQAIWALWTSPTPEELKDITDAFNANPLVILEAGILANHLKIDMPNKTLYIFI